MKAYRSSETAWDWEVRLPSKGDKVCVMAAEGYDASSVYLTADEAERFGQALFKAAELLREQS